MYPYRYICIYLYKMLTFERNHTTSTLGDKVPIDNSGLNSTQKLKEKESIWQALVLYISWIKKCVNSK